MAINEEESKANAVFPIDTGHISDLRIGRDPKNSAVQAQTRLEHALNARWLRTR
jgi:hypothetical protein